MSIMTVRTTNCVQDALAAARRLAQSKAAGSPRVNSGTLLPPSASAGGVVARQLAGIGFDIAAVEAAVAADRAQDSRRLTQARAAAVEQSEARAAEMRVIVDGWKAPPPIGLKPIFPQTSTVYLDGPEEIGATDGIDLQTSTIAPYDSRVQARWDFTNEFDGIYTDMGDEQSIHFSYFWTNPSGDAYAGVSIMAPVVLDGFCEVHSRGGFFAPAGSASLVSVPTLNIVQGWTQPVSYAPSQANQSWPLPELSVASSGYLHSSDETKTAAEAGVYPLSYSQVFVPPSEFIVVDVAMQFTAQTFNGRIAADFASGGYQVLSPYVQLTITS